MGLLPPCLPSSPPPSWAWYPLPRAWPVPPSSSPHWHFLLSPMHLSSPQEFPLWTHLFVSFSFTFEPSHDLWLPPRLYCRHTKAIPHSPRTMHQLVVGAHRSSTEAKMSTENAVKTNQKDCRDHISIPIYVCFLLVCLWAISCDSTLLLSGDLQTLSLFLPPSLSQPPCSLQEKAPPLNFQPDTSCLWLFLQILLPFSGKDFYLQQKWWVSHLCLIFNKLHNDNNKMQSKNWISFHNGDNNGCHSSGTFIF